MKGDHGSIRPARKPAKARDRQDDQMFRAIADTSLDGICICSLPGLRFVYVNQTLEQMLGIPRAELIGQAMRDFDFGPHPTVYEAIRVRLEREGFIRDEVVQLTNRGGANLTASVSGVVVEQAGERRTIWMLRDVTKSKETEESLRLEIAEHRSTEQRLRESEAIVRKIIETSQDCITISRLSDGTYRDVNDAFVKQLGYQRAEVIDNTPRGLQIWAEAGQHREFIRRLQSAPFIKNMEVSLRRRDGVAVPYLISAVLIELGSEQCIVSIKRDITEIKRAQQELTMAREVAVAASAAKTGFLSTMSHEIRTPMNAILGMAELLAETDLDPDQQRFVNIMRSNGNALLALINDILDIAKIESGRLKLEKTLFQLDELTDKVMETFAVRAHGKGLELIARVAADTPLNLLGDPLRLRQILVNLIGNAIKFTETGEVVLTVERDHEANEPGRLHFCVHDTGMGIGSDRTDDLFQSFMQADSSTTRRFGGSGLGLAIVKRLVELMNGRVWVESEPGKGSKFHFTASFAIGGRKPARKLAIAPILPEIAGMRTLIVDDSASHRLLLREILTPLGARLSEAADGAAALAAIKRARATRNPYHLVLVDCRMPRVDGLDVLGRLGERGGREAVVLMLSTDDPRMCEPRLRGLKVDAHVIKPLRKSELFEAVRKALSARGQAPAIAAKKLPAEVSPVYRPLKILMADDSADNRLIIRAFLKDTPYNLVEAENGADAVSRFKQERFDLILMDLQMPVMDGLAATRAIRGWEARQSLRPIPIVALTAAVFGDDVQRCFDAGVTRHMAKPVKKAEVLETIRQLTAAASEGCTDSQGGDRPHGCEASPTAALRSCANRLARSTPVQERACNAHR